MNFAKTKLKRKKCKYANILKRDLGVFTSDSTTKHLAVCNCGLVNGIDKETVYGLFQEFGRITDVIMLRNRSYCLVEFSSVEECQSAFSKIQGTEVWPEVKGPLYLAYISSIPESVMKEDQEVFKSKPPGLFILEDFISLPEEDMILECVGRKSVEGKMKHRVVKHYGYEFKYDTNNVDVTEPVEKIPEELSFLWRRLSQCNLGTDSDFDTGFIPDQLTINYYEPGQGIPPHVDTHSPFCDGILSLSLQSDVVMNFRNSRGEACSVVLPARSLCIMSGEARYGWTHGITPRKCDLVPSPTGGLTLMTRNPRTSLTFRKTRQGLCRCRFPEMCDSEKGKSEKDTSTFQVEDPASLERVHVHQVYENIANHFSDTRHKPWPNVVKFLSALEPGAIVVDIGCGNGKYLGVRRDCFGLGCDYSASLMAVCRTRGYHCFTCDCLRVPLRDHVADACISIAVIHHLSTTPRRLQAIQELVRVLKPGGRGLIYVWAKNQERQAQKSSYLKQGAKGAVAAPPQPTAPLEFQLPVHVNRTDFEHTDVLVPWKLRPASEGESPSTFLRYYHVFEEEELRAMCLSLGSVTIENYYYDQGNWCVAFSKLS